MEILNYVSYILFQSKYKINIHWKIKWGFPGILKVSTA